MKRNILTVVVIAIVLINTALTSVLVFSVVPAANRTNQLVDKIASMVDLELESKDGKGQVSVTDTATYDLSDALTINIKSNDGQDHYALVSVSLRENKKNADYETLKDTVKSNKNKIENIVTNVFQKYTKDEILNKQDAIKAQILTQIQELFKSDFIFEVTFGNIILK